MFFFHERARKINIWAFSFLIGPYVGPFIAALVSERLGWRADFGVLCGFYGFSVLMVIFLGDETLFDRSAPAVKEHGIVAHIKLLLGITGFQLRKARPTVWTVVKDQWALLLRPHLLLPTFGFVMIVTMWTIGLVSTITQFVLPPPYLFSITDLALLFFAPMIGTVLAELWGHWFNDFLLKSYLRKHDGKHQAENRLWGVYPAWLLGIGGLILIGQTLQRGESWVGIAFGWAMNCFSTLGTTTAISAYVLDCFPKHAALASAWLNSFRSKSSLVSSGKRIPMLDHRILITMSASFGWILRRLLPTQVGDAQRTSCCVWLSSCYHWCFHCLHHCNTGLWCQMASSFPSSGC